ncbi:hypothetical protein LINGRAHAP2_LOCUS22503 [Linum grandiflorum]
MVLLVSNVLIIVNKMKCLNSCGFQNRNDNYLCMFVFKLLWMKLNGFLTVDVHIT